MGLATFELLKMASPVGLATSKKVSRGLKDDVMGNGLSHGTSHFLIAKNGQSQASPIGLATSKKVSRGLKGDVLESGQSQGTDHLIEKTSGQTLWTGHWPDWPDWPDWKDWPYSPDWPERPDWPDWLDLPDWSDWPDWPVWPLWNRLSCLIDQFHLTGYSKFLLVASLIGLATIDIRKWQPQLTGHFHFI